MLPFSSNEGKRAALENLMGIGQASKPPLPLLRLARLRLHVHLSLLPRHALHAPLRAVSDRAYGFPALQSSPWLPGAHVPHPPPALSSRQAPPTSLTSESDPDIPCTSAQAQQRSGDDAFPITAPVRDPQSPPTRQEPGLHSTRGQILP